MQLLTRRSFGFFLLVGLCFSATHPALSRTQATVQGQGVPGKNVSLVGPTLQPAGCETAPYCGGLLPDVGLKQQNEPSCAISAETGNIFCGANDYRGADHGNGVLGDAWMGAFMSRNNGLTWLSRLAPGFKGGGSTSLGFQYGADPIVMGFQGGMMYIFIAGDRGENGVGGVFAQRWVEVNKEDSYPFVPTTETPHTIATGTAGRFLDKPGAMLKMLNSGTCSLPYQRSDGTPDTRTVPAFEVSVAYATFLGSSQSDGTSIWVVRSTDCGLTWDTPGKKITQSVNINQGVSIAAIGNRHLATWRTFTDSNQTQATIEYSVSMNGGQSWSKPATMSPILPFDQGTSSVSFRTTALPWLTSDGSAFHVFWSERRSVSDPLARIKFSSATNGTNWSVPAYVENAAVGHQIIPSATSMSGVTQLAWYDTRDDHTQTFGQFINDYKDASGKIHRHTADIRASQGTWDGTKLVFAPSVKVSSYRTGIAPASFGASAGQVIRLEDNFVNSRIFKQGTVPFIGDYIAVAAKAGAPGQAPSFFVAWTDNRSLRGNTVADLEQPTGYTPVTGLQGEPDPTGQYQTCTTTNDLSNTRNQEVFGAMIHPGLVVTVPSASKPTGSIGRAFVVQVINNTPQPKSYKVHIANQPPDAPSPGRASFVPDGLTIDRCIAVPRRSGAAVTVFVTSTTETPAINVEVSESDTNCAVVTGTTASVTLNSDPQAPDIENPDIENPDIENVEIYNPDIENRTFSFFSIQNPDIENPDFENYTIAFPDIENPDFENPDFENGTVAYPDIENPDIENPDMENAVLAAGGSTDVTWSVTMKGNTTGGIDAAALFSTVPTTVSQLIVRRVYETAVSKSCSIVQVATNQVVVNTVAQPGQQPAGSFYVGPGETVLITLRMPGVIDPATVGMNVQAQAGGITDVDPPTADLVAPVLSLPQPITVEATDASGATVTFSASADDDQDGSVPVQCTPASGSVFPLGSTTVDCSATDAAGNIANGSFDVTVTDTTAPVLSGVSGNLVVPATGPTGATVTFSTPTATDLVSGPLTVSCSPASGSTFPVGVTTVTCTATDGQGNVGSASFTVTVQDVTAPVVGAHANVTAEATMPSGAVVTFANPPATDDVGVASLTCAPASGSVFPLGATTVTCTAADAAGNTGVGTFSVSVVDTTPPAIAPHAPVNVTAASSTLTQVIYTNPTATDLVDGAVAVSCSPASGSGFPLGTTQVQCTATDSRQNQATSSFAVSVSYGFNGLLSPWKPNPTYTVNLGSSVPVGWQWTNATGAPLDTSSDMPTVTFTLLQSCGSGIETSTVYVNTASPGNSYFSYSSGNGTWALNWQTKPPVTAGCYNVRVISSTTGQSNGPFLIRLR